MKTFKATHKIVDETGEPAFDDSDSLVMKHGNHYCNRQVWEEGGRWETEAEIVKHGNQLVAIEE